MQMQPQDPDASLRPRFYKELMESKAETQAEGRPIYRDVEMVEIVFLNDRNTVIVEPVEDKHRTRFGHAYQQFKDGALTSQEAMGTPLDQWPRITPVRIRELSHFDITTVDQLAALSDAGMQRMGSDMLDLVRAARAFLQTAEDTKLEQKLTLENEKLKSEFAEMRDEIKALNAALQAKTEAPGEPAKRRGRPPKNQD